MRRRIAVVLTGIALAASFGATLPRATAAGASLQPLNLEVKGGEEVWHASRSFVLRWDNPLRFGEPAVVAVRYRLLDSAGQVVQAETRIGWAATSIEHLRVPDTPGAYTAEIWLEDTVGAEGTPATAMLRFDDARPGHVDPLSPSGWIGRASLPYLLRLGHPSGPEPASGIRGYAVSIDRIASGNPCESADSCTETDLRGGKEGDTLPIAELPEGTSYVHAVAVSGSGIRSASAGQAILRVDKTDPVTRLTGNPSGWTNRPVTLTAMATDSASGMVSSDGVVPFTAIQIDGKPAAIATGGTVSATVIDSGVHTVAYYARDAAGNVADGGFTNDQPNRRPATTSVRIDRAPPALAFSSSQDPKTPEMIEVRASDSLSGLDPGRGRISIRRSGAGERFAELPTEAIDGRLTAHWSSEDYPRGEYEFRATGYDRAGNAASTLLRANGSTMVLRNPLKVSTTLQAGLAPGPVPGALPFGRGASLSGRLIAGRRAPLVGAPVRIVERFGAGIEPRERVSTVRTSAGGAFTFRLAPGPNREVVAVFAGGPTLRGSSSAAMRLSVRGGLRLRASSRLATIGGPPVIFRGVVEGAIPPDGKLVQLQFRLPGMSWTEFRSFRTDANGRFRYAYRFADDDSRGVRFQIRAFAPAQNGWPYKPAGSRSLIVRGR